MSPPKILDLKRGRTYSADDLPNRLRQALAIRDAALVAIHALHDVEEQTPRSISYGGRTATFSMSYRTPTPLAAAVDKTFPGLLGSLPFGLDVWLRTFGKVLNIEWDDEGAVSVQSFHRGNWESEILSPAPLAAAAKAQGVQALRTIGN